MIIITTIIITTTIVIIIIITTTIIVIIITTTIIIIVVVVVVIIIIIIIIIIIAFKDANQDGFFVVVVCCCCLFFCFLFFVLFFTISSLCREPSQITYAQVARTQSCANHVQHIERSPRATGRVSCHVVRKDRVLIAFILALSYWLKPLIDIGGEETGVPGENPWRRASGNVT